MTATNTIKVWDIGVRLFHWALVACFVIAYISSEGAEHGGVGEVLHAWSGYAIIALLVFRIVWGFIGSRYARFSDFVFTPSAILAYIKDLFSGSPRRYLGHNPAGGIMVILMLVSLIAVSWTGLKAYQAEGKGPLAAASHTPVIPVARADSWEQEEYEHHGTLGGEEDELWEEAHEATVNFMLLLIVLHLGGVALSSLLHRENLPRAMWTGRKHVDGG
ncbi:MAG TPA: cytochrome b/b6 domain-containing protein [Mariprofundaceae bacterium]|nr:cytochrome b/b6 domain-containing protein [Mariprofundaceae bacterium]